MNYICVFELIKIDRNIMADIIIITNFDKSLFITFSFRFYVFFRFTFVNNQEQ